MITNKDAWNFICNVISKCDDDAKFVPEDYWCIGSGEYHRKNNALHVGTAHLIEDSINHPDEFIDYYSIFTILDTFGHELQHSFQEHDFEHMSYNHKLFHFIDETLPSYYIQNHATVNSYYHNNLPELDAELHGVMFAFKTISDEYGVDIANNCLNEYITTQVHTGDYFIDSVEPVTIESVSLAFYNKMDNVINNDFPFPDNEQVCKPISESYEFVPKGITQLELMSACVMQIRNYDYEKYVSKYGMRFCNTIREKYPDIFALDVVRDDLHRELPNVIDSFSDYQKE